MRADSGATRGRATGQAERQVVLLGLAAAGLYLTVYLIQRALYPQLWDGPGIPVPSRDTLVWLTLAFAGVTAGQFFVFGWILRVAARGSCDSGRALALVLALPVAIIVLMTAARPSLSIDVLTYIGQGHQVVAGFSPYDHPVSGLSATPFGGELQQNGWRPVHGLSPYGALWTRIETGIVRLVPNLDARVYLLKGLVTGTSLLCAWLIWTILGVVRRNAQVAGTAAYLWNPVVTMEFAGDGHNDAVMIALLLLSLLYAVRASRPMRIEASAAAMTLAALTKVTALMIAPLQLLYWWRISIDRRQLIARLGLTAFIIAALAWWMYAPYWVGRTTFAGVRDHSQPGMLASTPGGLFWLMTQWYAAGLSAQVLSVATAAMFVVAFVLVGRRVTDGGSLLSACGRVSLIYLMLAPGYWPWYAGLPIALLALTADRWSLVAIFVISLGARLAAPIDVLRVQGLIDWPAETIVTTVVGLWLPLIALIAARTWPLLAGRRTGPLNVVAYRGSS